LRKYITIFNFILYNIYEWIFIDERVEVEVAKYRMVRVDFWNNPIVLEEMTPEDKYFYLYLLTNPHTTQTGIYKITKKQMAFDLGYSIESVHSLMDRFTDHHKLIRYNSETRELAIKNWGKYNLHKGGKPVMDCIFSELKEVEDHSLIQYVAESINKQEIHSLYESFCKQDAVLSSPESQEQEECSISLDTDFNEVGETVEERDTIRGQKEKENKKEKQKQQQKDFKHNVVKSPSTENPEKRYPKTKDEKAIVEFWDSNGFGITNVHAKQQLLSWLDDSSFLQAKDIITKAMKIACSNNKRRLNYVEGILKNWEKDSLLTLEEVDLYEENLRAIGQHRQSKGAIRAGRDIPSGFELDLSAGEDW
jgi:DnaD/phage-associated family protein